MVKHCSVSEHRMVVRGSVGQTDTVSPKGYIYIYTVYKYNIYKYPGWEGRGLWLFLTAVVFWPDVAVPCLAADTACLKRDTMCFCWRWGSGSTDGWRNGGPSQDRKTFTGDVSRGTSAVKKPDNVIGCWLCWVLYANELLKRTCMMFLRARTCKKWKSSADSDTEYRS